MLIRVAILAGILLVSTVTVWVITATKACIYVGQGTGFSSIQGAINQAKPGDTLILAYGSYRENLMITKPIRLIAAGYASTLAFPGAGGAGTSGNCIVLHTSSPAAGTPLVVLEAADPQRPAIEIRAEGVELNGLVIRGGSQGVLVTRTRNARLAHNRISNSAYAGIALINVSESTVQENEVSQSETGILLESSWHNHVMLNRFQTNTRGLVLRNSRENQVRANRSFANQGEGFLMESADRNEWIANQSERNSWGLVSLSSSSNIFHANRFDRNTRSLRIEGGSPEHFIHQMDRSNTIDGRAVYYLVNERNVTIHSQDQPGFVALVNCEGITVDGITLSNGSAGIILVNTRASALRNNVLLNTVRGVYIWNSRDIELSGNRIERTEESGITLMGSQGIHLVKNYVSASGGHGVLLENSQENELSENQLEGNRESGAHLEASRRVLLKQNQIRNNWVGVFVEQGGAHVIQGNWIRENQFGIFVQQSSENKIADNRLENNHHDTNDSDQPPPPSPKSAPSSPSGGS
ncbi:MAG: hypothetical protein A2Z21_08120 [Candidatus Fraserbacteria bacterium RBG_16_55_9]|uniref:Carbohydrate-binding/sugar hydrolysis domain-containing protein n=1 Tax=Fraserbacteria sp. (strain RBG_16_55_9) TaxID=1817864 RepID=A0A1F5UNK4_FRAXR|nr:MAG: hypothetical protein A2Z21_08120 [Candidatus Fraserbacteria bacterium RBG_16_55_9]